MDQFSIFMITLFSSFIGTLFMWAFWTAPWIRSYGYRTARWRSWFFGTAVYVDIIKAVEVARKHNVWPWKLSVQLIFIAGIIGNIFYVIFAMNN